MLATISPSSTVIDETINTLRYAGLASTITNVPRIKTPHLRHEIDELREENARLKQELFLVKSKSMPSIHQTLATISKTSLASVDECIQTSFRADVATSPAREEESTNEEKLDIVDEEVSDRRTLWVLIFVSRFSRRSKINVVDRNGNDCRNNLFTKSVSSTKLLIPHPLTIFPFAAKVRKIDDTMLHRRLGTILSYVTDDFSVSVCWRDSVGRRASP